MSGIIMSDLRVVGNKAKGRISKRVFQEKQSKPHFPKNEYFLPPDMHTYVWVLPTGSVSFHIYE